MSAIPGELWACSELSWVEVGSGQFQDICLALPSTVAVTHGEASGGC